MENDSRQTVLNSCTPNLDGQVVLYWMQQAQRAEDNHALEAAIALGNALGVPVVTLFVLVPGYPLANLRHYTFMLEGLRETAARLRRRRVGWATMLGDPTAEVPKAVRRLRAAALLTDRGYLHHQRQWRQQIAGELPVQMIEVDTDCVIPCTLFPKEEYAAHTLRTKYQQLLPDFLVPIRPLTPHKLPPVSLPVAFDVEDLPGTLRKLHSDQSVSPSVTYHGGVTEAERKLDTFIREHLTDYRNERQDAAANTGSHLSPYLHYGQIAALRVALTVEKASGEDNLTMQSYLDELLIRRELGINFVWHNAHYDTPEGWPAWGRETLEEHRLDPRPALYTREQLAAGETGDRVWNAAQKELLTSGEIHNYPRMLWAKKLLEWTDCAEEAWEIGMWLNDWYAMDGRDANGYTNVAWCLAGKHDRPWPPHPIYGKIRYMSTANAGQHFSVSGYIARVNELCREAGVQPSSTTPYR